MLRFGQAVLCSRRGAKVIQPSPEQGQSKIFGDNQHPLPLTPMLVFLPLPSNSQTHQMPK